MNSTSSQNKLQYLFILLIISIGFVYEINFILNPHFESELKL
jgi:hypothetical protein